MASVQLKLGDMFDGPSDLIVLPCSTAGTITSFVRTRLVHYNIPYPSAGMKLGDVVVLPFEGGENIAQFVAYAASVEKHTSTPEAIERIGVQLGKATLDRSTIRRIAAPLLGAGAGGLESEAAIEALTKGFKKQGHAESQLVLHVLKNDVFNHVSSRLREDHELTSKKVDATRVFISYCHTSSEHEKWVESLGTFLRENGIDARLDVWHLRRGMDLAQFMTNELALAERVIVVSDERYAEKADGRVGGVGWETMIVQGDMAKLPPDSTKYLVVVRSREIDEGLPLYLKTKFVIHWPGSLDTGGKRELLLRELYNVVRVPEIGAKPLYL
jgi:hypothetical protein